MPSLRLITAPWRSTARRSGWSGCNPFWRRPRSAEQTGEQQTQQRPDDQGGECGEYDGSEGQGIARHRRGELGRLRHRPIHHRIAHFLYRHRLFFLARLVSQWSRCWTGIEIHPGAQIGRRLVIDHGMGIVIGETAEIGDDCLLYHGVTLGGTGKDHGKRHPTLGNNVMVSAGAKVLGPFKVGDNSRIAANAVVLSEIPPEATAVGVPARVVRIAGEKVDFAGQVDQIHVTDPVQKELQALNSRLEWLEQLMDEQARSKNL